MEKVRIALLRRDDIEETLKRLFTILTECNLRIDHIPGKVKGRRLDIFLSMSERKVLFHYNPLTQEQVPAWPAIRWAMRRIGEELDFDVVVEILIDPKVEYKNFDL